jgi:hypothetical protein
MLNRLYALIVIEGTSTVANPAPEKHDLNPVEKQRRYQHTSRGKHKHAARQKRYRERFRQKVTDQGSVTPIADVLLRSVKNKIVKVDGQQEARIIRCCFCKKTVSSWLRSGFLRYYHTRSAINSSYLRPP